MNWTKVLIPGFLKQFDGWLLKNKPDIWRTRIHYVLFYSAIVSNLLVFAFYHGFPLTPEMLGESFVGFRIVSLVFGVFAVLFWGWELRKYSFKGKALKQVMITLLIYWLGAVSISSNIWMLNKSFDFKVAKLVDSKTMLNDGATILKIEEELYSFEDKMREYKRYHKQDPSSEPPIWTKEFNIDQLIVRYGIPVEIDKAHFLSSKGYTPTTFSDKYNVSVRGVAEQIRHKIYQIERAQEIRDWTSSERDFRDFYFIFFIGLMGLPLLGLLLSNTSIVTIVSLAFAHFVLFLGIIVEARSNDVGFRYMVVLGIGLILMFVLKRNWKPFKLIHLFVIALIPIFYLFFQIDYNNLYSYPMIRISLYNGLFQTLVVTIIGGIGFWLYQRRITNPKTE